MDGEEPELEGETMRAMRTWCIAIAGRVHYGDENGTTYYNCCEMQ